MNILPFGRYPVRAPVVSAAVLSVLSLAACGSLATGGARTPSGTVITLEQIQAISVADAFDIVQYLRPAWLRSRGQVSFQDPDAGLPLVYLDHVRIGRVQSLRQIRYEDVHQIQYLDPRDATTRFGTNHLGGAILVTTRRP